MHVNVPNEDVIAFGPTPLIFLSRRQRVIGRGRKVTVKELIYMSICTYFIWRVEVIALLFFQISNSFIRFFSIVIVSYNNSSVKGEK